jgi:hypothetical protein
MYKSYLSGNAEPHKKENKKQGSSNGKHLVHLMVIHLARPKEGLKVRQMARHLAHPMEEHQWLVRWKD